MEPGIGFGIGSALSWGAGDFFGGVASRRTSSLAATGGSQLVGLLVLLVVLGVTAPAMPAADILFTAAVGGLMGGLGLVALYRGLALGAMGLVSAIAASGSIALALLAGALLGSAAILPIQLAGVLLVIGGTVAASGATLVGVNRQAVLLAVAAAFGFAAWYVLLDRVAGGNEIWVLVVNRGSATLLIGGAALITGRGRALASVWPLVSAAGVADVAANIAFVLARATIPVGLAAALSGTYPLATMLLARGILGERLPRLGLLGVGLGVGGVVLISLGAAG
ncbi:MAG TPA: EamA family transporter [Candidatus Limnocylindria bacterium]|nr:EamA family transporter [Candidatus Limnocylindria bacterium]